MDLPRNEEEEDNRRTEGKQCKLRPRREVNKKKPSTIFWRETSKGVPGNFWMELKFTEKYYLFVKFIYLLITGNGRIQHEYC